MNAQQNKLISAVISKTVGLTVSGERTTGFFPSAEKRFHEATEPAQSPDSAIRMARAELCFLANGGSSMMQIEGGCAIVPSFAGVDRCLRRHAEDAHLTSSAQRGKSPPFDQRLRGMLEKLAHGGEQSYLWTDEQCVSVEISTGRCECLDSTWHGVRGALGRAGGCKHARCMRLCLEARASPEAEAAVRVRAADHLRHFIHERERSKTAGEQRNAVLFVASKPGVAIVRLLRALQTQTSLPPTGKGLAAVSDALPEPSEEQLLSELDQCADADGSDGLPSSSRPAPGTDPTGPADAPRLLHCEFAKADDLGIVTCINADRKVVVVRFAVLATGAFGPAAHTGEQLRPGDVLVHANGEAELTRLAADGRLRVPTRAGTPLRLAFVRAVGVRTDGHDLGGRPSSKRAKYPARLAAERPSASAASPLLSGGSPANKGKKKQPVKSADKRPRSVRLSDFAPRSSTESAKDAEARVRAGLKRLLGARELPHEARTALDEELTEATYLP